MMNLKKILITGLFASSFLFANEQVAYYDNDNHYREDKENYDPCSPCEPERVCKVTANCLQTSKINTICSWNCNINASFLYWYATEEGLDAARITDLIDSSTELQYPYYFVKMPFKYHPAFKVGIGITSDYDDWNFNLKYLRYHINHKVSKTVENTEDVDIVGLDPFWISFALFFYPVLYYSVEGKWNLSTDIIDFELDRSFFVGKNLSFRPFVGIRTGLIDQKYDLTYYGIHEDQQQNILSKNKSDSWLLGPRAGFESHWLIGNYFKFLANGSASLFYQKIKVKESESGIHIDAGPMTTFGSKKINQITGNFEGNLGFEIGNYISNKEYHISLAATYDWILFLNQNWLRTINNNSNTQIYESSKGLYGPTGSQNFGNPPSLMFHGLTITAKFDF